MENIEKDRLIAKFIGWTLGHPDSEEQRWATDWFDENGNRVTDGIRIPLQFQVSWDWIMPAVAKCKEIIDSYEFDSEEGMKCEEIFDIDYTFHNFMDNQIGEIHERVVEFIQWYNNQNNK